MTFWARARGHAGDSGKLLQRGVADGLKAPEVLHQHTPTLGADAAHRVETGAGLPLGPQPLVVGDCEPVGLVPHALD